MSELKIYDRMLDNRTNCISIMGKMSIKSYLDFIKEAFEANGNLSGQRGVIKNSSSAAKIRDRMNKDFQQGAIFPPVVIGILSEEERYDAIASAYDHDLLPIVDELFKFMSNEKISIIDGMQRTNIYNNNLEKHADRIIRVEFWVAKNLSKLLYRMLVLNTGQVPWNVRRQLEVIYKPYVEELKRVLFLKYPELKDRIKLYDINDTTKRYNSGEYQKSQLIELYLAFNLRSEKVDVQTQLAEDFHKLDMIESLEEKDAFSIFVDIFAYLCKLDLTFGKINFELSKGRFKDGKSLFASNPFKIGFMVAACQYILGKMNRNKTSKERTILLSNFKQNCDEIIRKTESLLHNKDSLREYLDLDYLNDYLATLSKSRVGDVERRGFKNSFYELFKEDEEIISFNQYWREF